MLSSRLDKIITLEKYTSSTDEYGEFISSYVKVKDTFASVNVKDGNTQYDELGPIVIVNVDFRIRYFEGLNYQYRIKYNNDYYKILYIQELGRKSEYIIKTILFEDE